MGRKSKYRSGRKSFGRNIEFRKPKKSILLVTEGKVNEPLYFEALKKHLNISSRLFEVDIQPQGTGVPSTLITRAEYLVGKRKENKSPILTNYDEVWLLFDTDTIMRGGSNQRGAENVSRLNSLRGDPSKEDWRLGYCNPCFEYFLLLHEEYTSGSFTSRELVAKIKKLSGVKNPKNKEELKRSGFYESLVTEWQTAMTNALRIERDQEQNGNTFPEDIPNTTLGGLLESLSPS